MRRHADTPTRRHAVLFRRVGASACRPVGKIFLLLLACAALSRGESPTLATTPAAPAAPVATPETRHTFSGVERAPDGRLQYLFLSGEPVATNKVFMGGDIGGRQLLGYSPATRELTLSGPGKNETVLVKGGSFTQPASTARGDARPPTEPPAVVASASALPQTATPQIIYFSGMSGASMTSSARRSYSSMFGTRAFITTVDSGLGAPRKNEFFFGTEYLYPTSFEVKSYPMAMRDGRIIMVPVVVPGNFRPYRSGTGGKNW